MASKKEKELEAAIKEATAQLEEQYSKDAINAASFILKDIFKEFSEVNIPAENKELMEQYNIDYGSYWDIYITTEKYFISKKKILKEDTSRFVYEIELILHTDENYKDISFSDIKENGIDNNNNLIANSLLDLLFKEAEKKLHAKIDAINLPATTKKPSKRAAENQGIITTLDGALAAFTDEELEDALNAFSISSLVDTIDNYDFDKAGKLHTDKLNNSVFTTLEDINTGTLQTILKAVIKTHYDKIDPSDGNTKIKLFLPSICKEAGIDPRGFSKKRTNAELDYSQLYYQAFSKKILPFDSAVGRLKNGNIYRVLSISEWDEKNQIITIDSPFFFKALEIALAKKKDIIINDLFMPKVINEKNHAAIELATKITNDLLNQKFKAKTDSAGNKIYEYKIKYSVLIDECPQLSEALKGKTRQAVNAKLKRAFLAAYEIINTKTHAKKRFENLNLQEGYPSTTTLKDYLIITCTGINKNQ